MSPAEWHKFLTDLCGDPPRFAAFLMGGILVGGLTVWLTRRWHRTLTAQLERSEKELRKLKQQRQPLEELLDRLNITLEQLPGWVKSRNTEVQTLKEQIAIARQQVEVRDNTIRSLTSEMAQKEVKIVEITTKVQDLTVNVSRGKQRCERLEVEKQDLEQSTSSLERDKQKLEITLRTTQGRLTEAEREATEASAAVKRLGDRNKSLTEEKARLEGEYTNLGKENIDLKQKLATSEVDRATCEARIASLAKQAEIAAALKTQNETLEEQAEQLREDTRGLQQQIERQVRAWNEQEKEAENRLNKLRSEAHQLNLQLQESTKRVSLAQAEKAKCEELCKGMTVKREELEQNNRGLQTNLRECEKRYLELQTKLNSKPSDNGFPPNGEGEILPIGDLTEKIWEREVAATVPEFRPLSARKMPIISVMNLKGGVGKTTVTINLGATLWRTGARVLLVDLDFQASLTLRCLSQHQEEHLLKKGTSIRQFFAKLTDDPTNHFLAQVTPIDLSDRKVNFVPQHGKGHLVAADEKLADVETGVMLAWLLRKGQLADVRFNLRQALHADAVQKEFNYVLIDCPPRLTTACINALAASDYILVPVLADATSAERVPQLLEWLDRLKTVGVCPCLQGAGILVNRLTTPETAQETADIDWLKEQHKKVPLPSKVFDSRLRDDSCYKPASRGHWPAVLRRKQDFNDIRHSFDAIVQELSQQLVME